MNNNRIPLIISIVALIGVVLVFVKVFTSNKTTQDTNATQNTSNIAFVNVDSVLIKYDLYNKLSIDLTTKQQQLEKELQSKMMSLQNRANQLQSQYSQHLITTQTYQEQAEKLTREQEQLQRWQQEKSFELNEDQMNLTKRVYDSIVSVIKVVNKDKKYDLIISNSTGGTLFYGNPQMDITSEVIKILNEKANIVATNPK